MAAWQMDETQTGRGKEKSPWPVPPDPVLTYSYGCLIAHVGAVALGGINKLVCEFKFQTDKLIQEGYCKEVVEHLQNAMCPIVMGCVVSTKISRKEVDSSELNNLHEYVTALHELMEKHGYAV